MFYTVSGTYYFTAEFPFWLQAFVRGKPSIKWKEAILRDVKSIERRWRWRTQSCMSIGVHIMLSRTRQIRRNQKHLNNLKGRGYWQNFACTDIGMWFQLGCANLYLWWQELKKRCLFCIFLTSAFFQQCCFLIITD